MLFIFNPELHCKLSCTEITVSVDNFFIFFTKISELMIIELVPIDKTLFPPILKNKLFVSEYIPFPELNSIAKLLFDPLDKLLI